MKGISLIELIVVIAIIASLSAIGANSFINIKNDADIDAIADGLISDIKLARNKSMNGELLKGETENSFDEDGLPEYGINITQNNYRIVRRCTKVGNPTACDTDTIDSVSVNSQYKLSPKTFFFDRITGTSASQEITIGQKDDKYKRDIDISDNFVITVSE